MSRVHLRGAVRRLLMLEKFQSESPNKKSWGWDALPSLYATREKRKSYAAQLAIRFEPVSEYAFRRNVPIAEEWPGIANLVVSEFYGWRDNVWTQLGSNVPIRPTRKSVA